MVLVQYHAETIRKGELRKIDGWQHSFVSGRYSGHRRTPLSPLRQRRDGH
jgi:hypothetical protein